MRQRFPETTTWRLDRQIDAVRYLAASVRFPAVRGTRMRFGAGVHLAFSRAARMEVGKGFVARRDLTMIIAGSLRVGQGFFCNRGVAIVVLDSVTIGEGVRLGERVSILDHNHVIEPIEDLDGRFLEYETAPVTIGSGVLVGANTVILAGATIGADTVIGAGSVVRGQIPARVLAAGVPATVERQLRHEAAPKVMTSHQE